MTFQQIGQALGVSRQTIHQQLQQSGQEVPCPGIACRACGRMLAHGPEVPASAIQSTA